MEPLPDEAMARDVSGNVLPPDAGKPVRGIAVARRHLAASDPDLAALIRRVGPCGLRMDPSREPAESLVRAVAHQQLHGRAAEAMLGRLDARLGGTGLADAGAILRLEPGAMRACGFSGAKEAAIRGVCEAALDGRVPSRARAARLSDAELIERLSALRGIGRWTVEMLLIFSLGRTDIMPADDFGVREGYRLIRGAASQPRPRVLLAETASWSPWRSMAAWYLWRAADLAKLTRGAGNPAAAGESAPDSPRAASARRVRSPRSGSRETGDA